MTYDLVQQTSSRRLTFGLLSGRTQEIAKSFVGGLQTVVFREEMNSHIFETLENIIREDREELSTRRDILKNLIRQY